VANGAEFQHLGERSRVNPVGGLEALEEAVLLDQVGDQRRAA
jgi:hypothetical protein